MDSERKNTKNIEERNKRSRSLQTNDKTKTRDKYNYL
jgi:hypothetical protein